MQCTVEEKLRNICVWATSDWRHGQHRQPLAARLIAICQSRSQDLNARLVAGWPLVDLQSVIFDWLCSVDTAQRSHLGSNADVLQSLQLDDIIVLVGELVRLGCFSFSKYLQRLTARGMTAGPTAPLKGAAYKSVPPLPQPPISATSLHQRVLRSVPLAACTPALSSQRRAAIYGTRLKESHEEASERRLRRELRTALPWLHRPSSPTSSSAVTSVDWRERIPHFWTASQYTLTKVVTADILPALRALDRCLTVEEVCALEVILVQARDFPALSEVSRYRRSEVSLAFKS